MSELDNKQKVLVAFYTEYQKDNWNLRNVTAATIGISNDHFIVAIQKLENEGLIAGTVISKVGKGSFLPGVITDNTTMTNYGLSYVEEKLEIKPTMSAGEKVKEVTKKATLWGYNELKDFGVKILAEVIKG